MPAQPRPDAGPGTSRPRVLLTRAPEPSARLAEEIAARHPQAEILISPLMAPAFLAPPRPEGPVAAVAFTSETGVAAAAALGWDLPRLAYCVGDRTAAAARAAGFAARSAAGDAAALVALVASEPPPGPVLHLRGADAAGEVAARLSAAGIPAREAVVYDQRPLPLSPAARAWLAEARPVCVPLYSPRSARLFAAAAAGAAAPLWCAAISPAAAAPVERHAARLEVAARPDGPAMAAALDRLIVTPA